MAQQLTIQTWCDVCLEADDKTAADEQGPFLIGTASKVVVDVCERHRKELIDPLAELLARHARAWKPPSQTPKEGAIKSGKAKVPCPECGNLYAAGAGLGSHRWRAHGIAGEGRQS